LSSSELKNTEKQRIVKDKFSELEPQLATAQKADLQKTATSFINTTHGTLTEDTGIQMFEEKYSVKLDTSQTYFKKKLDLHGTQECHDVFVGGKVDGICTDKDENKFIVEVKNRMKGFFNGVREYEKTQIQLYMWILGLDSARLVERYRDKIKITMMERDDSYINMVLRSLAMFFQNFYERFMLKPNLKEDYLNMSTEEKKHFLRKLYLSDIQRFHEQELQQNLEEDAPDCLIDDDLI
jgi:hypothetical protein